MSACHPFVLASVGHLQHGPETPQRWGMSGLISTSSGFGAWGLVLGFEV